MLILVPAIQLSLFGLEGPHAHDPFSSHLWGMVGFYGAYALIASTLTSAVHTWLIRRSKVTSAAAQVLWAAGLGAVFLIPQALAFGRDYWFVNVVAGLSGGVIYGLLVTPFRRNTAVVDQGLVRRTRTRRR